MDVGVVIDPLADPWKEEELHLATLLATLLEVVVEEAEVALLLESKCAAEKDSTERDLLPEASA